MTETEKPVGKRKKEIPLVTWQQKKPRDGVLNGQPYTWAAIRENPDKPQQIQGWRRIPKPREPTIQPSGVDTRRVEAWQNSVSPEDASEERLKGIIESQQNQPPKSEEGK